MSNRFRYVNSSPDVIGLRRAPISLNAPKSHSLERLERRPDLLNAKVSSGARMSRQSGCCDRELEFEIAAAIEYLDHLFIFNEAGLRRIISSYLSSGRV